MVLEHRVGSSGGSVLPGGRCRGNRGRVAAIRIHREQLELSARSRLRSVPDPPSSSDESPSVTAPEEIHRGAMQEPAGFSTSPTEASAPIRGRTLPGRGPRPPVGSPLWRKKARNRRSLIVPRQVVPQCDAAYPTVCIPPGLLIAATSHIGTSRGFRRSSSFRLGRGRERMRDLGPDTSARFARHNAARTFAVRRASQKRHRRGGPLPSLSPAMCRALRAHGLQPIPNGCGRRPTRAA